MKTLRLLFAALVLLCSTTSFASGSRAHPRASVATSAQVRSAARKLANVWVEKAAPETLGSLSQRSIAFAGMVSGTYVMLDGKRFSAAQALMDSALTLLNNNTFEA